jgi:hypothetical protein
MAILHQRMHVDAFHVWSIVAFEQSFRKYYWLSPTSRWMVGEWVRCRFSMRKWLSSWKKQFPSVSCVYTCIYNLTWLPLKTWRKPCRATLALQSRNWSPYGRSALPTCDDGIAHHWAHLKCTVSSSTLLLQNADRYLPSSRFLSLVVCGWYCIYHWPWTIRNNSRPAEPENFPKRAPSSQELEGPEVLAGSSAKISGAMANDKPTWGWCIAPIKIDYLWDGSVMIGFATSIRFKPKQQTVRIWISKILVNWLVSVRRSCFSYVDRPDQLKKTGRKFQMFEHHVILWQKWCQVTDYGLTSRKFLIKYATHLWH